MPPTFVTMAPALKNRTDQVGVVICVTRISPSSSLLNSSSLLIIFTAPVYIPLEPASPLIYPEGEVFVSSLFEASPVALSEIISRFFSL
ncbi:hypothetical protein ABLV94_02905 [Staphylococcus sp. Mo2-7]